MPFPNEEQLNSSLQPPNMVIPHNKRPFLQDTARSPFFSLTHTAKGASATPSSAHGNLTVHRFLENGFSTVHPLIPQSPSYLRRCLSSTSPIHWLLSSKRLYFFLTSVIPVFYWFRFLFFQCWCRMRFHPWTSSFLSV